MGTIKDLYFVGHQTSLLSNTVYTLSVSRKNHFNQSINLKSDQLWTQRESEVLHGCQGFACCPFLRGTNVFMSFSCPPPPSPTSISYHMYRTSTFTKGNTVKPARVHQEAVFTMDTGFLLPPVLTGTLSYPSLLETKKKEYLS